MLGLCRPTGPHIDMIYETSPSPLNPLGVKGVGETGTVPAAAAIVSAVENALEPFGARLADYPVKPATLVDIVRRGMAAAG